MSDCNRCGAKNIEESHFCGNLITEKEVIESLKSESMALKASLIEQGKERDELLAVVKLGLHILEKSVVLSSIHRGSFVHDDMRSLVDKIEGKTNE